MIATSNIDSILPNIAEENYSNVFDAKIENNELHIKVNAIIAKTNFKKLVKTTKKYDSKTSTFIYQIYKKDSIKILKEVCPGDPHYQVEFGNEATYFSVPNFEKVEAIISVPDDFYTIIARCNKTKDRKKPVRKPKKPSLEQQYTSSELREMAIEHFDDQGWLDKSDPLYKYLPAGY